MQDYLKNNKNNKLINNWSNCRKFKAINSQKKLIHMKKFKIKLKICNEIRLTKCEHLIQLMIR